MVWKGFERKKVLAAIRDQEHKRRDNVIREEVTEQILEAKKEKGLTYAAIAEQLGTHKVWTTAALLVSIR